MKYFFTAVLLSGVALGAEKPKEEAPKTAAATPPANELWAQLLDDGTCLIHDKDGKMFIEKSKLCEILQGAKAANAKRQEEEAKKAKDDKKAK